MEKKKTGMLKMLTLNYGDKDVIIEKKELIKLLEQAYEIKFTITYPAGSRGSCFTIEADDKMLIEVAVYQALKYVQNEEQTSHEREQAQRSNQKDS